MAMRRKVVRTLEEAAALVQDGDVVGIGGFVTTNKPMAILRALARRRVRDLTVVAGPASVDVDLLLGLGMVKKLICPYVGAEVLAPLLPFHSRRANKDFGMEEVDLGTLLAMLRAHIQRLPFLPVRGPVGTSFPALNPNLRWMEDPFGGPPIVAAAPLRLDVALIHAGQADPYGNVRHGGAVFLDPLLAQAARTVIVEVEELISNETIRKDPLRTTLASGLVSAVTVIPYGAHPTASQNRYGLDADWIRQYVQAARACLEGRAEEWRQFIERYVESPPDHAAYLETVGLQRLFSLGLEVD